MNMNVNTECIKHKYQNGQPSKIYKRHTLRMRNEIVSVQSAEQQPTRGETRRAETTCLRLACTHTLTHKLCQSL